ncbi:MAG: GNAT family N-acetyltransferase, partial [Methanobacterium sp.]
IPFKLLENLHKYGSDHVELSLATKDDKIIAGRICFLYSKTVYAYLNAFLSEYGTFNPTSLLINESIKKACDEGFKYVNVGSSGNNYGLKKFKESFGSDIIKTNMFKAYSLIGKLGLNTIKMFK